MLETINHQTARREPPAAFPVTTAHNIYTYNTMTNPSWNLNLAQAPKTLPTISNNTQQPVGVSVPSQTIHIPEDLYEYLLSTKDEDQSTSARATELMQQGKDTEEDNGQ